MDADRTRACRKCGSTMSVHTENHRYVEAGLPNVILQGVDVYRCGRCRTSELEIQRITKLFEVLANGMIRKLSRLSGDEIAFLRNYLGWTGVDMAEHMGVDSTTVSAWENERKVVGPASDRLLRMFVASQLPLAEYDLSEVVDEMVRISGQTTRPRRVVARPTPAGWDVSAA